MRYRLFLMTLLMALLLTSVVIAGDRYDYETYVRQTKTQVIYYGTVTFATANLEDNHFTKFFQIDDCNKEPAYLWAYCTNVSGTEDINAIIHFSSNTDTSLVGTNASGVVLDQITATTMRCDTLSEATNVGDTYYSGARFMRINFDGQASNVATTLSWWAIFKKNDPDVGAETQILSHKE